MEIEILLDGKIDEYNFRNMSKDLRDFFGDKNLDVLYIHGKRNLFGKEDSIIGLIASRIKKRSVSVKFNYRGERVFVKREGRVS